MKDETVRMAGGRLFHARDAATGKARSPRVICYKFTAESVGKRILKIGQHLAKLWATENSRFFSQLMRYTEIPHTYTFSPKSTTSGIIRFVKYEKKQVRRCSPFGHSVFASTVP